MTEKIKVKDFRIRPGHKVHLDKWPTLVDPFYKMSYPKTGGERRQELQSIRDRFIK